MSYFDKIAAYLVNDSDAAFGLDETSGQLHVRLFDEAGLGLEVDSTTGALKTIDYAHNEIHSGANFFIKGWVSVANAGTNTDFLFTTPNTTKWAHMTWEFVAEDAFTLTAYEAVTTSADGSAVTAFNNNRNSGTTATLVVTTGPTLTAVGTPTLGDGGSGGTTIWAAKIGTRGSNMTRESEGELILKQNKKYWLRLNKTNAGTHYFDYLFEWYEHTNEV